MVSYDAIRGKAILSLPPRARDVSKAILSLPPRASDESKIYNYTMETTSYDSDISECNCSCCNRNNFTNIKLFNTATFSDKVKQILEMYIVFNKRFPNLFDGNYCEVTYFGENSKQDFKQDFNVGRNLNYLSINCDVKTQLEIFYKNGYILMTPYNNEDILIIGCGHFPIEDDMEDPYWKEYSEEHGHIGCYTIDPNLSQNPDIVGVYGDQVFKHLPDNSFSVIETEGVRITPTPIFFRETKRLLKEGGILRTCQNETLFVKQHGELKFIYDNDYYNYRYRGVLKLYIGVPDIYEWNWVKKEYGTISRNQVSNIVLPKCYHQNYDKFYKLVDYYDDDELDTLFFKVSIDNNPYFKDISTTNNLIGKTLYYFTISRYGKETINFQYLTRVKDFIKSNEKMVCGHNIPITHFTTKIYDIEVTFTAENGHLIYVVFQVV